MAKDVGAVKMFDITKFIKFNIIGLLMTVLTFILYFICNELFAFSLIISNIISYTIPVVFSFILNEIFTFNIKLNFKERIYKITIYLLMKFCFLFADTVILILWVTYCNIDKYFSKIINTILLTILSFKLTQKIIQK